MSAADERRTWGLTSSETVAGAPALELDRRGTSAWVVQINGFDPLPRVYTLFSADGAYRESLVVPTLARSAEEADGKGSDYAPDPASLDPVRAGERTLKRGSRGDAVATLQADLNQCAGESLVVDGLFGPKTKAAVERFQEAQGLIVDGVVGPKTLAALDAALGRGGASSAPAPSAASATGDGVEPALDPIRAGERLLRRKDRDEAVAALQRLLNRNAGASLSADGIFGRKTEQAVERFQASAGLSQDGLVGPKTLEALDAAGPPASATSSTPGEEDASPAAAAAASAEQPAEGGAAAPSTPAPAPTSSSVEQGERGWTLTFAGVTAGQRYTLEQRVEGLPADASALVFRDRLPPRERNQQDPFRLFDEIEDAYRRARGAVGGWLDQLFGSDESRQRSRYHRLRLRNLLWAQRGFASAVALPAEGAASPAQGPSAPVDLELDEQGLLPDDKNPNEVGLTDPNHPFGQLISAFDGYVKDGELRHKSSSKRHVGHVNGLDGLTCGAFHFASAGSLASFFKGLLAEPGPQAAFLGVLSQHLQSSAQDRGALKEASGVSLGSSPSPAEVEQALRKTLCRKDWCQGLREDYKAAKTTYKLPGWIWRCLNRGLRAPAVGAFQVEYFRGNHLSDAEGNARRIGLDTLGAIASSASARSSGLTIVPGGSAPPKGKKWGQRWDRLPKVDYADGTDWREASPESHPRHFQDWWAVCVWARYNDLKNEVRSRMAAIWHIWYRPTWGPVPALGALPQAHSGTHMLAGTMLDPSPLIGEAPAGVPSAGFVSDQGSSGTSTSADPPPVGDPPPFQARTLKVPTPWRVGETITLEVSGWALAKEEGGYETAEAADVPDATQAEVRWSLDGEDLDLRGASVELTISPKLLELEERRLQAHVGPRGHAHPDASEQVEVRPRAHPSDSDAYGFQNRAELDGWKDAYGRWIEARYASDAQGVLNWIVGASKSAIPARARKEAERQRAALEEAMEDSGGGYTLPTSKRPIRPAEAQYGIWWKKFSFARESFDRVSESALAECEGLAEAMHSDGKWHSGDDVHAECWKEKLSDEGRQREILEASSAPGISRHHWGSDFDLFGELDPAEFDASGTMADEYEWMQAHAASSGFVQAYTERSQAARTWPGKPSVGQDMYFEERWHWSYHPLGHALLEFVAAHLSEVEAALGAQWDRYQSESESKLETLRKKSSWPSEGDSAPRDLFAYIRARWKGYMFNVNAAPDPAWVEG